MQNPLPSNETNQTSNMEIRRDGSQPSITGEAEHFTGTVHIDPVFEAKDPSRLVVSTVTFEPSAHTSWHSQPQGQIPNVLMPFPGIFSFNYTFKII
jgi:quercetin dioxygenase-like cupin family protein